MARKRSTAKRMLGGQLIQGTLDMMVLKALTRGPAHGYGIARAIRETSDDVLRVEEGSLYPALHRMAERGLIASTWRASENNRRAKYYSLTAAGRERLVVEVSSWQRLSAAIERVLALRGRLPLTRWDGYEASVTRQSL